MGKPINDPKVDKLVHDMMRQAQPRPARPDFIFTVNGPGGTPLFGLRLTEDKAMVGWIVFDADGNGHGINASLAQTLRMGNAIQQAVYHAMDMGWLAEPDPGSEGLVKP